MRRQKFTFCQSHRSVLKREWGQNRVPPEHIVNLQRDFTHGNSNKRGGATVKLQDTVKIRLKNNRVSHLEEICGRQLPKFDKSQSSSGRQAPLWRARRSNRRQPEEEQFQHGFTRVWTKILFMTIWETFHTYSQLLCVVSINVMCLIGGGNMFYGFIVSQFFMLKMNLQH